jgi:uncharacterized 2Fe-2S/4Fe-4S cluster protein (DUF4445 family)
MPATVTINGRSAQAAAVASLFDIAASVGVQVPTSCRKQGKCKECIVEISEGAHVLSERTEAERHLRGNFRLSCQASVTGGGHIRCHTMRRGHMRIEGHATGLPLGAKRKTDAAVTRDGDRILIDGEEVERSTGPIHGIAMDLGTTTVVLRLLDLETGELIAAASFENPQRFGGSDVMARISYDGEHRGLMMRTLAGYLTHAIEEFPVDPLSIYELVVAGNSTMRDLFFWQSVHSIGQNPYRSITEIEMAQRTRGRGRSRLHAGD